MREPDGYRLNLERIDAAFDHEMLTVVEVAQFVGCSKDKARRDFAFNARTRRISKSDLARQISAGA